jgi:hypothetical protein
MFLNSKKNIFICSVLGLILLFPVFILRVVGINMYPVEVSIESKVPVYKKVCRISIHNVVEECKKINSKKFITKDKDTVTGINVYFKKNEVKNIDNIQIRIGPDNILIDNKSWQEGLKTEDKDSEYVYFNLNKSDLDRSHFPVINKLINWKGDLRLLLISFFYAVTFIIFILILILLIDSKKNMGLFYGLLFVYICILALGMGTNGDESGYIALSKLIFHTDYSQAFFKDLPLLYVPYALVANLVPDSLLLATRLIGVISLLLLFIIPIYSNKILETKSQKIAYFIILLLNTNMYSLNLCVRQYSLSNVANLLFYLSLLGGNPLLQGLACGIAFSFRPIPLLFVVLIIANLIKKEFDFKKSLIQIGAFISVIFFQIVVWKIYDPTYLPFLPNVAYSVDSSLTLGYYISNLKSVIGRSTGDFLLFSVVVCIITARFKEISQKQLLAFVFVLSIAICYIPNPAWEHYIGQLLIFNAIIFSLSIDKFKKHFLMAFLLIYLLSSYRGIFFQNNYIPSLKLSPLVELQGKMFEIKKLVNTDIAFDTCGISYISGFKVDKRFSYPGSNTAMCEGSNCTESNYQVIRDKRIYTKDEIADAISSQKYPVIIWREKWHLELEKLLLKNYDEYTTVGTCKIYLPISSRDKLKRYRYE